MGQVFEAEHLLLKRACAIKLIQPERSADDRAHLRFELTFKLKECSFRKLRLKGRHPVSQIGHDLTQ